MRSVALSFFCPPEGDDIFAGVSASCQYISVFVFLACGMFEAIQKMLLGQKSQRFADLFEQKRSIMDLKVAQLTQVFNFSTLGFLKAARSFYPIGFCSWLSKKPLRTVDFLAEVRRLQQSTWLICSYLPGLC